MEGYFSKDEVLLKAKKQVEVLENVEGLYYGKKLAKGMVGTTKQAVNAVICPQPGWIVVIEFSVPDGGKISEGFNKAQYEKLLKELSP